MNFIRIQGANVHNLNGIDVEIPRHQLVVVTGVSGSGKSSLVFDTIYAEGQRRYIESLSAYARQFLGQLDRPDVDRIEGLSPAISIDQKSASHNPRSTVGTVTEIYDYLRLLFASIGQPHCPNCGQFIQAMSIQEMVDGLFGQALDQMVMIFSPLVNSKKGEFKDLFLTLRKAGFSRVRVDGKLYRFGEIPVLSKQKKHSIDLFIDKLVVNSQNQSRLFQSIETATQQSEGMVGIEWGQKKQLFSEQYSCLSCSISLPEISNRLFSFNSPVGACEHCNGLGELFDFDVDLVIEDPQKPLRHCTAKVVNLKGTYYGRAAERIGLSYDFDLNTPFEALTELQKNIFLYGTEDVQDCNPYQKGDVDDYDEYADWEGIITNLRRRFFQTRSEHMRFYFRSFMSPKCCRFCRGARLKKEGLCVLVDQKSIWDLVQMDIVQCLSFFDQLELDEDRKLIAKQVLDEISARLSFLKEVGLDYLSLSRKSNSLSGGEFQRIRLASQIGSGLTGVLYVLDEPSIGLHQRDNQRLIAILKRLRDLGNTVLVVEHDEDTIRAADYIVEIGPLAGKKGGNVVFSGTKTQFLNQSLGLTAQYLIGEKQIEIPPVRRELDFSKKLVLSGVHLHNLQNVTFTIPLHCFICVTGVSGSGKSTLIYDVLYPLLMRHLHRSKQRCIAYETIDGMTHLDKVITIDQSPIGKTPRSNPATYTGVFGPIRELFCQLPLAKVKGYKPGQFSFNVKGGRCAACEGDGVKKIEMHFLSDVYIECNVCKGQRYHRETLAVLFKGKSISDVLNMTVNEALLFFDAFPSIVDKLKMLSDVGLGYIHLGQNATTLSGGEAQRVKLAKELAKKSAGKTLYLLDEPTTGLHFYDVNQLLCVLNRLVNQGNTVLVIEHNMDVIKMADYVVDMGPGGGVRGGQIIASGRPEDIVQSSVSYTGAFLKKVGVE